MIDIKIKLRYHSSLSHKDNSTGELDNDSFDIEGEIPMGIPEPGDPKENTLKETNKFVDKGYAFWSAARKLALEAKKEIILKKLEAQRKNGEKDVRERKD
jgi:hypothetical protein